MIVESQPTHSNLDGPISAKFHTWNRTASSSKLAATLTKLSYLGLHNLGHRRFNHRFVPGSKQGERDEQ